MRAREGRSTTLLLLLRLLLLLLRLLLLLLLLQLPLLLQLHDLLLERGDIACFRRGSCGPNSRQLLQLPTHGLEVLDPCFDGVTAVRNSGPLFSPRSPHLVQLS